ncbi:glycosyltransferase [Arthrobacter mobilis]|nr:glycosyltransferase [Arthrobacter mobilis]
MAETAGRTAAALPEGKYFMVLWGLAENFGGMTTMCLHRAGAFSRFGGREAAIISFEPKPSYQALTDRLREQGKLAPGTQVLNVFQHYRDADLDGLPAVAQPAVPEDQGPAGQPEVVLDPSGEVFMRTIMRPDGTTVAHRRYYRPDGTEFFRDEAPVDAAGKPLGRYLTLLDRTGNAVGRWRTAGDFYRHWMRELAGGDRAVFIVDSGFAAQVVAPLDEQHILKLVVIHNSHIAGGGDPFTGKLATGRKPIFEDSAAWDGLVFLTRKQREDYELRFGRATNLFTVSNPKPRAEALPPFEGRDRRRGVMVVRLESQKNVADAVDVMALVHQKLPDVVLDVYGKGSLRDEVQARIEEQGLTEVVRLRGHAPNAAAEFETACFSLLTSRNEGQPLALMESLGRGCPPVSYDIRYGPSDVIEDGVNGFLVPARDTAAAAERVVRLCTDAELAREMGRRAWERSEAFSDTAVIGQWAAVLEQAWRQVPDRVVLSGLDFTLRELGLPAAGGLEIEGELAWRQSAGPALEDLVRANLVVGRRAGGAPVFFPAEVLERGPGRLRLRAAVTDGQLDEGVSGDNGFLDIYLQVEGNNVLHTFRIGYPGGSTWRPYATVHGSLSLQYA